TSQIPSDVFFSLNKWVSTLHSVSVTLLLCYSEVELRTHYTITYNETVCHLQSSNTLDISLLAEGKHMLGTSWHKTKQDKCIKYHIVCITCCSSQSFSINAVMSSLYHDFEGLSLINILYVSL